MPLPAIVYRAEAYEEQDKFREQKWSCEHAHDNPHEAYACGQEWLGENQGELMSGEVG